MIGGLAFLNNLGNTAETTSANETTKAEIREAVDDIFNELVNFQSLVKVYKITAFDYDNQQSKGESVGANIAALVTGLNRREAGDASTTTGERTAYVKYRDLGFVPEPQVTRLNYKGNEYRVEAVRNPFDADALIAMELVPL